MIRQAERKNTGRRLWRIEGSLVRRLAGAEQAEEIMIKEAPKRIQLQRRIQEAGELSIRQRKSMRKTFRSKKNFIPIYERVRRYEIIRTLLYSINMLQEFSYGFVY